MASKRARADSGAPSPTVASGAPRATPFDDAAPRATVLSTLYGAHSVGKGLLSFFSTREARALRLVNDEMRAALAGVPWADAKPRIARDLRAWRASFPKARKANISGRLARAQERLHRSRICAPEGRLHAQHVGL